jgi:anion-transporting  ArsA/GET3 family ATPase
MSQLTTQAEANLDTLIREKKVLVLCGAGGVGKTTTSAAVALAGAQAGRRVLVLTIDPARRLAEALGIPPHSERPSPVPRDRLVACGLTGEGTLDAWMLDPSVVFDRLIRKLAPADKAPTILNSRIYRHMTELVAGMQEYTAAEALYEFATEGRYDLIVLDTPPSRNALDFLDAPNRLARFLDDSIVQLFLPKEGGLLRRAGRIVSGVFSKVFGESFIDELQIFLGAMSGMFSALLEHTEGVRQLLAGSDSSFLLVTSTEEESVREALFFRDQILHRQLPFSGFVLNRSYARLEDALHPEQLALSESVPADVRAVLSKLGGLADRERERARADSRVLARLKELAGRGRLAVAAPHLGDAVEDLPGLFLLARGIAG